MSNVGVKIGPIGILLSIVALASSLSAETSPAWTTFVNRAWSIQHPGDWSVDSCEACGDSSAAEAHVNFFPPQDLEAEGSVMIEPMPDKPADVSTSSWLKQMPTRGNHNPLRRETRIWLNGAPALKVRYQTDSGDDREDVYVVSGAKTYAIEFSTEKSHMPLEMLANFTIFERMLGTFQVTSSE